jgi:hypothetical protein
LQAGVPNLGQLLVRDLNRDGRAEIVAGQGNSDRFLVAAFGQTFQPVFAGAATSVLDIADLNGDRRLDVIVTSPSATTFRLLLGNGDGSFGLPSSYSVGVAVNSEFLKDSPPARPSRLVIADLNSDARPDVVIAHAGIYKPYFGSKGGFTNGNITEHATYVLSQGPSNGSPPSNGVASSPQPASISGQIFEDINGNGNKDAGENGLANWLVYVDQNRNGRLDAGERTASTRADGTFTITSLAAGTYTVAQVLPQGWLRTTSSATHLLTLANGQAAIGRDFGVFKRMSISGQVYIDLNGNRVRDAKESALARWLVYLDANNNGARDGGEAWTFTNASGGYRFADLPVGATTADRYHAVRLEVKPGWTGAGRPYVFTFSGRTVTGIDFAMTPPPSSIAGVVFIDRNGNGIRDARELGLGGVIIFLDQNRNGKLDPGETATASNADGSYRFTGLKFGTYIVAEATPKAYRRTGATSRTLSLNIGQSVAQVNFGNMQVTAGIWPVAPNASASTSARPAAGYVGGVFWM